MKFKKHYLHPLILTLTMVLLTLGKLAFLYVQTCSPKYTVLSFIRTAVLLGAIYITANQLLFRRFFAPKLIVHELLAVILLCDTVHYKYFGVFPSAAELQMLGEAAAAWESVKELLSPAYLIFFADLLLLPVYFLLHNKSTSFSIKRRFPAAITALLVFCIVLDGQLNGVDRFQTYDRFGLLHFHGKQIEDMLTGKVNQNLSSLSLKSLEDTTSQYLTMPKYFGLAENKNVVVIQVEALQNFVLNRYYNDQELTPNLNQLIRQDSLYFDNYYQHTGRGNTSDAEFVILHSLYATSKMPAYKKYANTELYGLPQILKDDGYSTAAFHGYKGEFWDRSKVYPTLGIDYFMSLEHFVVDEKLGWGISDKSMFRQTAAYLENAPKPFFSFIITLSSHHPYKLPKKNQSLQLLEKHEDTLLGNYLQAIRYTDAALGEFIEEMKALGLYDNTVFAIYGDHQAISAKDEVNAPLMTELLGFPYDVDEMIHVPLLIHIPNSNVQESNSIASGHVDFMPTMLNLLGISKGNIQFYGQDLCNAKKGLAPAQYMVPKGTFIGDELVYAASPDGVFEKGRAWNRKTREPVDLELCRTTYEKIIGDIDECEYLLSNNMLLGPVLEASAIQKAAEPPLWKKTLQKFLFFLKD